VESPSAEDRARNKRVISASAPSRWIRALLKSLGPGIITGAADDDPSGIATYSIAGAQLGTKLLRTALLTWPLMAAVQMMCARIGKVTGQGLAANFKQRFPKWLHHPDHRHHPQPARHYEY
jgi:Mn2+/Fe2+ NRAMP family transporter